MKDPTECWHEFLEVKKRRMLPGNTKATDGNDCEVELRCRDCGVVYKGEVHKTVPKIPRTWGDRGRKER